MSAADLVVSIGIIAFGFLFCLLFSRFVKQVKNPKICFLILVLIILISSSVLVVALQNPVKGALSTDPSSLNAQNMPNEYLDIITYVETLPANHGPIVTYQVLYLPFFANASIIDLSTYYGLNKLDSLTNNSNIQISLQNLRDNGIKYFLMPINISTISPLMSHNIIIDELYTNPNFTVVHTFNDYEMFELCNDT
jgi:hypothetical protein